MCVCVGGGGGGGDDERILSSKPSGVMTLVKKLRREEFDLLP